MRIERIEHAGPKWVFCGAVGRGIRTSSEYAVVRRSALPLVVGAYRAQTGALVGTLEGDGTSCILVGEDVGEAN